MATRFARLAHQDLADFTKRVLVILLIGTLALAVWRAIDLAILLFAAILMAVGLRAVASVLVRATGIGAEAGLACVVVLFVAAFALALWFFGTIAAGQLDELAAQIPAGLRMLVDWLEAHPYGRYVLVQVRDTGTAGATGWVASVLGIVMRSLMRGVGYAILTFVVAIYLAAQPQRYRRMCLRLIPWRYQSRAERLFDETANILRRWLLGQVVVMTTIGILSGIGLWVLGIEAAFALGLVGGLLTFIPFVGAVLAAVPATLVALTQGPVQALSVVLMYIGIHFVEGNFITPLVQAEATALPPALSLLSIAAVSILFGAMAVPLAAPLTLFLMIAVDVLYAAPAIGQHAAATAQPPPDHDGMRPSDGRT